MTDLMDLQEHNRPIAPKIEGATDVQRRQGRRLAAIHRMHLQDVARLRRFVDHIEVNRSIAKTLADAVNELDMTRNLRDFGALCGRECNVLLFHHGAEEHRIFPMLEAQADTGLRAVVAKLREEHLVIHKLIETLGGQAKIIMDDPSNAHYQQLKTTFDQLEAAIKSHFAYEEVELEEALGVYGLI